MFNTALIGYQEVVSDPTQGRQAIADSYTIRATALEHEVAYTTTLAGAEAMVFGNRAGR